MIQIDYMFLHAYRQDLPFYNSLGDLDWVYWVGPVVELSKIGREMVKVVMLKFNRYISHID
jgi:hypothetical protein